MPIESPDMMFATYKESEVGIAPTGVWSSSTEYLVPPEYEMRPVRMEVHDRMNVRGEIPERISLLASNRTIWRTFTLPEQTV